MLHAERLAAIKIHAVTSRKRQYASRKAVPEKGGMRIRMWEITARGYSVSGMRRLSVKCLDTRDIQGRPRWEKMTVMGSERFVSCTSSESS